MQFSYKKTAALVVFLTIILAMLLIMIAYRNKTPDVTTYTLKNYNGTVVLYKNEEIIDEYEGIVVSNLPYADRRRLERGITVQSPDEVQSIIEDYDG